MTRSMTKSLWVRQTAYTVIVVAAVAIALTGTEIMSSYHGERARLQAFGNQLIDSFYDAAARAAFHVDRLQAEAVIEGLMKFEELQYVSISTDLNTVLARRTRQLSDTGENRLAVWDGAESCAVFASGMAAIGTTLLQLLSPGDVLLHSEPVYGGTDFFIKHILPKFGVSTKIIASRSLFTERSSVSLIVSRVLPARKPTV